MFLLLLTKPSYKDGVLDPISVIKSKTIVARLFGNEALEISSETRRGEGEKGRRGEGEKGSRGERVSLIHNGCWASVKRFEVYQFEKTRAIVQCTNFKQTRHY
jgi:hypothetical protein